MSRFDEIFPADENWMDNCIAILGSQNGFVSFGIEKRKKHFWSMREILAALRSKNQKVIAEAYLGRREYRELVAGESDLESYYVPVFQQRFRALREAPIWGWVFQLIGVFITNMWDYYFVLETESQIRRHVPLTTHQTDTYFVTENDDSLKTHLMGGHSWPSAMPLCHAIIPGFEEIVGPFCPIIFSDTLSEAERLAVVESHLDNPTTRSLSKDEIDYLWRTHMGGASDIFLTFGMTRKRRARLECGD